MSFIKQLHSLSESTRKKILVLSVGIIMIPIFFALVASIKGKLAVSKEDNHSIQTTEDIKKTVQENLDSIKLQGSAYKSILDKTLDDVKNDNADINTEKTGNVNEKQENKAIENNQTSNEEIPSKTEEKIINNNSGLPEATDMIDTN